ncbi:alpha/beta hydrolase [Hoyosella subflava]|uniref:alpha/beta hydrolase n=1 Tax=Hoyosella subflava TaxID=639313 RepID=UPI00059C65B3|nr:alpha/beta hydrolase family protein [Hoyosella subflava]
MVFVVSLVTLFAASFATAAPVTRVDEISVTRTDIYVDSPAMQRTIRVHVLHPAHSSPRPTFYLLDGNEATFEQSDWITKTDIVDFAASKNVNVVLPAGGEGSYYTDWQQPDPEFGVYMWETFLTEELPPIIDSYFNGNGRNAIGGISMGGQAAFTLTSRHPGLYRGVVAISACPLVAPQPYQDTVRAGIAYRGGDATNMWGPRNAPAWFEHDPAQNLGALRDKPLYLYAGNGTPGRYEQQFDDDTQATIVVGGPIEAAALTCSADFAARLGAGGITPTVDFRSSGTHSWPYWQDAIRSAWPTVEAAVGQ